MNILYQEVAKALNDELDPSYLAKIRKGVIKNPGRDALKLLCLFFHVPASYFFPELELLSPPVTQTPETNENQVESLRVALHSNAPIPTSTKLCKV